MSSETTLLISAVSLGLTRGIAAAEGHLTAITIATVNNGDMVRIQGLTDAFNEAHPDITLERVTLKENVLRQNLTTDISTGGGAYDVMTIGTYEVPIWAKNGWLVSLNEGMADDLAADDLLPAIAGDLTIDGELYASPFYGESSMVTYRTDLMEAAGREIPDAPTWDFIREAGAAMTDRENDINGICARGKAGRRENMAFFTAMSNSFGARWFDEDWTAQFDRPERAATIDFYLGIWIDAAVAASFVTGPDSTVADSVGFALAPDNGLGKRGNWLWAWSLAIPSSSEKQDAAKTFISWATGPNYAALVAENEGWASVPPGTRTSLYENQAYLDAAPFAEMTLQSILSADPTNPSIQPVPYTGIQFVAVPEFAGIATQSGQQFSDALAGNQTAAQALANAQEITIEEMKAAGY